jgi:hypothetical protein
VTSGVPTSGAGNIRARDPCVRGVGDPQLHGGTSCDVYAGIVFHSNGDCFEIYDNVDNSRRVRVSWNYVGVDDKIKYAYSDGWRTLRCPKMKEPAEIYFKVKGHDASGYILYDSPIARWRTYG